MGQMLDSYFECSENGITVRTELPAGATTFLTMVYIVFVNPSILQAAGMDQGAVFVATYVVGTLGTLIMGARPTTPWRWRRAWG